MIQPISICLFGGTFDPIHEGHIHIATLAQKELNLDKVIFLPCLQSPHKLDSKSAPSNHRLAMCNLATKNLKWAEVHDYEITAPAPSYTWKTAEFFKKLYPQAQLYWLMGTDQWNTLHLWRRHSYLAEMVEFIICTRNNEALIKRKYVSHSIHSDHPANSTAIRNSVAYGSNPLWLETSVRNYLEQMKLYTEY